MKLFMENFFILILPKKVSKTFRIFSYSSAKKHILFLNTFEIVIILIFLEKCDPVFIKCHLLFNKKYQNIKWAEKN